MEPAPFFSAIKKPAGAGHPGGFFLVAAKLAFGVTFRLSRDHVHCVFGIVTDARQIILRKEVIQPQVPLRLPCYDLVPIAELTFGTCLPCGLAWRLRAPPTFVA